MRAAAVLWALRWTAQALRPKPNPLRRRRDRWTAAVMTLLVLLAVLAVPVAAAVGHDVHQRLRVQGDREAVERTQVTARLVEPARMSVLGSAQPQRVRFHAPVSWVDAHGARHGAWAEMSASTADPGDEVRVWVDGRDQVVTAPLTAGRALASGISVGVLLGLAAALCCAGAVLAVRRGADAHAGRAWAREWEVVSRRWGHRGPADAE